MAKHLYFAYGMNIAPDYMYGCELVGTGDLDGWELYFASFACVRQVPAKIVSGVLWELDDAQLARMDRREDYPRLYTRELVQVTVDAGQDVTAIIYVPNNIDKYPISLPSEHYFDILVRGYRYFDLPLSNLTDAVYATADTMGLV